MTIRIIAIIMSTVRSFTTKVDNNTDRKRDRKTHRQINNNNTFILQIE